MDSFRASFSDFAAKYSKEERFKGIEKMRDRESLFNDFVQEVRRKEREESRSLKEKVGLVETGTESTSACVVSCIRKYGCLCMCCFCGIFKLKIEWLCSYINLTLFVYVT